MSRPILLTGYEPFGDHSSNPSANVTRTLDGETVAGHSVIGDVMPVRFAEVTELMGSLIDEHDPCVVLATGLAAGRSAIAVERFGVNVADAVTTPDNANADPVDDEVVPDGPTAYRSTLPCRLIVQSLSSADIPARISNSAGTHLCNQALYAARHHIETKDANVPAGFIHLPLTPPMAVSQADDADRGGTVQPSIRLNMQLTAVRRAMTVTVDALV